MPDEEREGEDQDALGQDEPLGVALLLAHRRPPGTAPICRRRATASSTQVLSTPSWRTSSRRSESSGSNALSGSSDLYAGSGRRPHASINFVTSHDGFTLHDLVSYERKHNDAKSVIPGLQRNMVRCSRV